MGQTEPQTTAHSCVVSENVYSETSLCLILKFKFIYWQQNSQCLVMGTVSILKISTSRRGITAYRFGNKRTDFYGISAELD